MVGITSDKNKYYNSFFRKYLIPVVPESLKFPVGNSPVKSPCYKCDETT